MTLEVEILESLLQRYATKIFDPNYILSSQNLRLIQESANLAPTSFGLQPFKIIHITDPLKKRDLRNLCWNQKQIADASDIYVYAVETDLNKILKRYSDISRKIKGYTNKESGSYLKFVHNFIETRNILEPNFYLNWAKRQAYISLGFMIYTSALIKIDTCPIEGFENSLVDEFLGLSKHKLNSVVILAIGRSLASNPDLENLRRKVRIDMDDLIIDM